MEFDSKVYAARMEVLRNKLKKKRTRIKLRYDYYDQKKIAEALMIAAPAEMNRFMPPFGWCAKAVDSIADRLLFNGFDFDTDVYGFNEIVAMNNPDVLFDGSILDACISACSFIYNSKGNDGPQMQVINGMNATGTIEPLTNMLKEGYAILDADEYGNPTLEAYFDADYTVYFRNGKFEDAIPNPAPYPLLVPIIYRPDATRPFGHSRLTRSMMACQDFATRTFLDAAIASGVAAFPQKYITGLADDVEINPNWKTAISKIWAFYKDEDGQSPQLGQFPQIMLTPYNDHMRMCAAQFAGEADLTMDDLGYASVNPTSPDAMRIAHENLRLRARKAQRTMGTGFKNACYLAACVRDNTAYTREAIGSVRGLWEPIFEPDPSTLSAIGDGISKINAAVPGYAGKKTVEEMTGVRPEQED